MEGNAVPRTPSIRYYESRQAYYTKYQGRQHLLASGPKDEPDGPTYRAAVERFARVMHLGEAVRAEDGVRVSVVISRYYHHLEQAGRGRSQRLAESMLDPAIAAFGHVLVRELKPFAVSDWLAAQHTWGSSSRATALSYLGMAFNWAVRQGMIAKNPVAGMSKPEMRVRGKEMVMPEALQDLLVAEANPALAKVLRVLRGTGARPAEVTNADCRHYRPAIGALVFPWNPPPGEYRWKNGKKTKRDRVVYLTPELVGLVEAEVKARGGKGRVFLTRRGHTWDNHNLQARVALLAEKPAVAKWCRDNGFDAGQIICYSFRHTYITRMLTAGCPIKLLADLCGTSVAMIEKTYGHAHDDHESMRRLFLQFSAAASSPPPAA
jgi:integrase